MCKTKKRKHATTRPCEEPRACLRAAHHLGEKLEEPGDIAAGVGRQKRDVSSTGWNHKGGQHELLSGWRCTLRSRLERELGHKEIRPIHLHCCGDAAMKPVLNALLPALFGKVQQFSHLGGATQSVDDLDVFSKHTHDRHSKRSV